MGLVLYHAGSAPCRFVLLVAAALNLHLEQAVVNLFDKKQWDPEFAKLSQHSLPTLIDDGFAIWETHAIGRYLVNKYGEDSTLYPKDPQTRALVDQKLELATGLYKKFSDFFYPQITSSVGPNEELLKSLNADLEYLDKHLEDADYVVGSNLTLADLSLASTISTIDLTDMELDRYYNIKSWLRNIEYSAPKYREVSRDFLRAFEGVINRFIRKIRDDEL